MFPSFFFDELVSEHAMEEWTKDRVGQTDSLSFKNSRVSLHPGLGELLLNARLQFLFCSVYAVNDVIRCHRFLRSTHFDFFQGKP